MLFGASFTPKSDCSRETWNRLWIRSCDVIQLPTMQNSTWFYCCGVLTVVLHPAQGLYLDSTCSTVTGQNGTWFRLGSLVKGKNYLLEPSIRKWSIVGNPSNPMCGKWEKNFLQWITTLDISLSECLGLRYRLGRIRFSSTAKIQFSSTTCESGRSFRTWSTYTRKLTKVDLRMYVFVPPMFK